MITLAMVAAAAVLAALFLLVAGDGRDSVDLEVDDIAERAASSSAEGGEDPLAFDPGDEAELARRAILGTSHVIYANSPGGVVATAARTAQWRDEIEAAAKVHDVDPKVLEAIVFLESAGRSQVMAGETPEAASGLAQILPGTATDFLGMRVDLDRSIALTRQIGKASSGGKDRVVAKLVAERARIDERFDPERALAGAATYLKLARERLGAGDLAVVSYHMGIGNLESVIAAYGAGQTPSYTQLFFDSSPQTHREAWRILASLGDDSSLYYWKVEASRLIMERWRRDEAGLQAFADLATEKATLEEVYHPRGETEVFTEPDDVADAIAAGELVLLPMDARLGFRVTEQAGELAPKLGAEPERYRALRPEALAALIYLAAKVKAISGERTPLQVTSATRDESYQELLTGINPEATQDYSLHTTGFAFDIRRRYGSDRQAAAFQFALDRLRAHAIIDYAVEPAAIHITVSDSAAILAE